MSRKKISLRPLDAAVHPGSRGGLAQTAESGIENFDASTRSAGKAPVMELMRASTLPLALALAACTSSGEQLGYFSDGPPDDGADETTGAAATGGTDDASTDAGTSSGDGDPDDPPKFDVGSGDADGGDDGSAYDGCRKIDLLLAIDDSVSMSEEIAALRLELPKFLQRMQAEVGQGIDSFHIGVIDASASPMPYLHRFGGDTGLVDCQLSSGSNYIESGSATVDAEFECLTAMSDHGYFGDPAVSEGSGEEPTHAAAQALSSPAIDLENADFLRDDAVLVVVVLTDEDEQKRPKLTFPPGSTKAQRIQAIIDYNEASRDMLYAAKGNAPKNVVFVGIGGDTEPNVTPDEKAITRCQGVYGEAGDAFYLRQVTRAFDRHVWWDLCGGNIDLALDEALKLTATACEEFVPAG